MDTRLMPSNRKCPVVGILKAIDEYGVTVSDARGEHRFAFGPESFVRGFKGDQMPVTDAHSRYRVGDEIIVAYDDGMVRNMRPQT
jgi:hypothetical protein